MATTPPTKKEMNATIPSEPIMRSLISRATSFLSTEDLVNFPKVFWSIIKYLPMCSSNLTMPKNTQLTGLKHQLKEDYKTEGDLYAVGNCIDVHSCAYTSKHYDIAFFKTMVFKIVVDYLVIKGRYSSNRTVSMGLNIHR